MPSHARPHGIANRQRRSRPRRDDIRILLDHLLDAEGERRGLAVALVGERTIRRLNRDWMDDDAPTDVLSFPMGAPPPGPAAETIPAGEIVICVPVCERAASARRAALHDEIARMLVHGALHVLGYDHARDADARRMRPRERRYLAWYRRRGLRVVEVA